MKASLFLILFLLAGSVAYSQVCINVSTECNGTNNYSYCYNCTADHCGPYELSKGIYRIPFEGGTDVEITGDHFTHCPRGRIDMVGDDDNIVAAADGWIREIVDTNSEQCTCDGNAFCENNYIWMEHANGEWTKYTHMQTNSVPSSLNDDDWVSVGTLLGLQGDVGCAGGVHLHFEVAQPIDTNTLIYDPIGGYINDTWAQNVIPVICGIVGNVFEADESYIANDCPSACGGFLVPLPVTYSAGGFEVILNNNAIENSNDLTFESWSSGLFQAGNEIVLTDGFHARTNSAFTARIGDCNESPLRNSGPQDLSIQNINTSSVGIYPNPATALVTIQWNMAEESEVSISITDMGRRTLLQPMSRELYDHGKYEKTFDVASLAAGIYLVVLETKNQRQIEKLVIQK